MRKLHAVLLPHAATDCNYTCVALRSVPPKSSAPESSSQRRLVRNLSKVSKIDRKVSLLLHYLRNYSSCVDLAITLN